MGFLVKVMLLILFVSQGLLGQVDSLWSRSFGGDQVEVLYSIAPMSDGGYIAGGFTESNADSVRNYWLLRLNESGDDTLWTRSFLNDSTLSEGKEGQMGLPTSDGGAIIVGPGNPRVIKTDGEGNILWRLSENELAGAVYKISETADGGYIVCGNYRPESISQAYLAKITQTGTVSWEKFYAAEHDCYLLGVLELEDGTIAAAGAQSSLPGGNSSDAWLFSVSATGDSLKSMTMGVQTENNAESFTVIKQTESGDFMLLGTQELEGQSRTPFIVKAGLSAGELWSTTLETTMVGELLNIISTADGNFLAVGYGDLSLGDEFNTVLIKVNDADGSVDWAQELKAPHGSAGAALHEISAGEYLMAGIIIPGADIPWDGWIVRLGEGATDTQKESVVPTRARLFENYPNPFNPSTNISYTIPAPSQVILTVYDVGGSVVAVLQEQEQSAGYHEVQWNAIDLSGTAVSTGIYFARLQAGEYSSTIKMVYLK